MTPEEKVQELKELTEAAFRWYRAVREVYVEANREWREAHRALYGEYWEEELNEWSGPLAPNAKVEQQGEDGQADADPADGLTHHGGSDDDGAAENRKR